MWSYQAPLRDMQFVLEHWLQAPDAWEGLDLPWRCTCWRRPPVLPKACWRR